MIKYSVIIIIFSLALLDILGLVTITAYTISLVLFLVLISIVSYFTRINGASYFLFALLMVIICTIALFFKSQNLAEEAAIWSYLFMIVACIVTFLELNATRIRSYITRIKASYEK